jgi:hypothetical protein
MRASAAGAFVLCLGLAAGCGGSNKDEQGSAASNDQNTAQGRPAPVTQTGCLTARGDQFVLTDLDRGTTRAPDQAATETYQLIGNTDELRQHVGKQVRVNGEAEPAQVAEVRETTPAAPQPNATGTSGQTPAAQPQGSAQAQSGSAPAQGGAGQAQSGSAQMQGGGSNPQVTSQTETRLEVAKLRVQSITPTGESCAAETKQP